MRDFGPQDSEAAATLAAQISNPTARAVLAFLVDHAGDRLNGAAIADQLGLPEHKDVGRATFQIGAACAAMGLNRPWHEAQQGYAMSPEIAKLFHVSNAPPSS